MKSQRLMLSAVLALSTAAFAQRILDVTPFSSVPFLGEDPMPASAFAQTVLVASASPSSASEPSAAQSETHKMDAPKSEAPKSEAQISFNTIKTLAGDWEGPVNTDMSEAMKKQMGTDIKPIHVSMRVTSRGNVLVEEFQEAGTPLDATKFDHPVTMFYVDADKLDLVHYCDAGNRPRMTAKTSPDGKTIEFTFADLSGGNKYGHMHHAVFTIVDANHHIEEWTYMTPGDKPIHASFDLHRTN